MNLVEIVHSKEWNEEDKDINDQERIIAEGWGLSREMLNGMHQRAKVCRVYSPSSWNSPPCMMFKLNFDGVVKGNPGAIGLGGVCINAEGEIIQVFHGLIELNTNNATELEGLIQGLGMMLREG